MVEYDLHMHSNFSDGLLSPFQIISLAKKKGIKGISITDHDTIGALEISEKISEEQNIDFVPGIELSTDYFGNEIHILGYYINYKDAHFVEYLNNLQISRYQRAEKIIQKLNSLGYKITINDVAKNLDMNLKSIGRPHIARTLIEKGYFKNTKEVFDKLLGFQKPAFVERFKLSTEDAIKIIKDVSGIAVAAHPLIIKGFSPSPSFENYIRSLISYGLNGIEVYHTLHTRYDEDYLLTIARKYDLLVTGGSDCHGNIIDNDYMLGSKGIDGDKFKLLKKFKE